MCRSYWIAGSFRWNHHSVWTSTQGRNSGCWSEETNQCQHAHDWAGTWDLTKSLEVFDGTTIVHEQALSDATPVVGQNSPEDVCMHAIERARDDVTESPDVMNYHTGVLEAGDWTLVVLNLKSDNLIGQNLLVLAW